jgi:hypothetical protein
MWCREKGRYDVLLSNVSGVLQEADISSLIEPSEHGCPDKEVAGRHADALGKDRKRVLKAAAEKKRALEDAEEKKEKRAKRTKVE